MWENFSNSKKFVTKNCKLPHFPFTQVEYACAFRYVTAASIENNLQLTFIC